MNNSSNLKDPRKSIIVNMEPEKSVISLEVMLLAIKLNNE